MLPLGLVLCLVFKTGTVSSVFAIYFFFSLKPYQAHLNTHMNLHPRLCDALLPTSVLAAQGPYCSLMLLHPYWIRKLCWHFSLLPHSYPKKELSHVFELFCSNAIPRCTPKWLVSLLTLHLLKIYVILQHSLYSLFVKELAD